MSQILMSLMVVIMSFGDKRFIDHGTRSSKKNTKNSSATSVAHQPCSAPVITCRYTQQVGPSLVSFLTLQSWRAGKAGFTLALPGKSSTSWGKGHSNNLPLHFVKCILWGGFFEGYLNRVKPRHQLMQNHRMTEKKCWKGALKV